MKFMKKLAGVLAATVLSVGMLAGTAFALDNTTVQVTGVEAGDTVTAYQIAGVTVTASNELQVTMNSALNVADNPYKTIDAIVAASDKQAMFDTIAQLVNAGTTQYASQTVATGTDYCEFSFEPGYYLLRTTATNGKTKVYQYNVVSVWPTISGNAYVKAVDRLISTDNAVAIKVKPAPSVTKLINGEAAIDNVADGKDVAITITTTIPSYPADATYKQYVLTDVSTNMTNKLDTLVVKAGEITLVKGTDYTVSEDFVITFSDNYLKTHGSQNITITYTATLAIGADKDGLATNAVTGTFHSSPYNSATANTNTATVTAKTYGFYFVKVGAATATAEEKIMPGTTFDLYSGSGDSKVKIEGVVLTADANGYVYYDGLAAGEYTLVETKAGIAGYGMVDPFPVTLSASVCITDNPATPAQDDSAKETNYVAAGTQGKVTDPAAEVPTLPTTGGIGTIVFSVLGVLIMAAAVVLFVRRKQSEK